MRNLMPLKNNLVILKGLETIRVFHMMTSTSQRPLLQLTKFIVMKEVTNESKKKGVAFN